MCVSELQVKEIVHAEIKPLEEDMRSARNWAIGLLSTLIVAIFGIGVWVGAIENRVQTVETEQNRFEDRVEGKLERIENLLIQLNKEVSSKN